MSGVTDGEHYDFGFTVEKDDWDEVGEKRPETLWKVSLPHKCDQWRIDNDTMYLEGSTKEEAVEELEEFIRQAGLALDSLKAGLELNQDR